MTKGGGVRFPTVIVFIIAGFARADLVPVCDLGADITRSDPVAAQAHSPSTPPLLTLPSVDELPSDYLDLDVATVAQEKPERPAPQLLIDRSDSFDLCLYALISLGVFRSGSWLRRPSLGFVPNGTTAALRSKSVTAMLWGPMSCTPRRPVSSSRVVGSVDIHRNSAKARLCPSGAAPSLPQPSWPAVPLRLCTER